MLQRSMRALAMRQQRTGYILCFKRRASVTVIADREAMLDISTIRQDVVVAADEVKQLTNAVEELPEHSPLRDFVSGLLDAVSRGAGVSLVEQDKELSPNEVAALLQVSRPHVMKMIHAGVLSAHPVGKHYRIMFSDFRDFADRRARASKHVAEVIAAVDKRSVAALEDEAMKNLSQL